MKIIYSPYFDGHTHLEMETEGVRLSCQTLESQGLLQQLALHAGIHVEIPSDVKRLTAYHRGLMEYDRQHTDNIFHRSISIDSMSVAKTLMEWRDKLCMGGWNFSHTGASTRLDTLAGIEAKQDESVVSMATLLKLVAERLGQMQSGEATVPNAYKDMEVEVLCPKEMLPDYMLPVLEALETVAKCVAYGTVDRAARPEKMYIIEFTDQYKAESWLAKQKADDYDVWLNQNNKRLDNWLHMSGEKVSGSEMVNSNPQITQLFLLAIQLFQRPLNVNTLLQYLYLPECPLPWELTSHLATVIVREGGFASSKVQMCIGEYLESEYIEKDENRPSVHTADERQRLYHTYLPFDLLNDQDSQHLALEDESVDLNQLKGFMKTVADYAARRANGIKAMMPNDIRVAQLQDVVSLVDALLDLLDSQEPSGEKIPFTKLQQWAQSLYDTSNYRQYAAQVGCRNVLSSPADMASRVKRTIWCDFYGDADASLSTDFLSPRELECLYAMGVRLWNKEREKAFRSFMLEMPIHQTREQLTFVACKKQGATDLPIHPLYLQLPKDTEVVCGDDEYGKLPSCEVEVIDNHREEDALEVCFDAKNHSVEWRDMESFSALSELLQNPLDYFIKHTLKLPKQDPTEIKMSLTMGNVAHETIEMLFTARKNGTVDHVLEAYDSAFDCALAKKGALLLLPEHHMDRDKLHHQLRRCVMHLEEVIEANQLTLVTCEQKEMKDLGLEGGVDVVGYIDMLLEDASKKPVIFDLKWTSSKDKYQNCVKDNRAMQLAMYKAMLLQHEEYPEAARTAYFVMPTGRLVTQDDFVDCHLEKMAVKDQSDLMEQIRLGYMERKKEISEGRIETADLQPIHNLKYAQTAGVFPLEQQGTRDPKKAENKYSDYKCFMQ